MHNNYFTLVHVARDLQRHCAGAVLTECYSQGKNELVVSLNNHQSLIVSCEPSLNTVYSRTRVARAKKNSLEFFPSLRGLPLRSVSVQDGDRELLLEFKEHRLIIQLFGPKANVYLTDHSRRIVEAFLRPRETTGMVLPQPIPLIRPTSIEEFKTHFLAIGHLPAYAVVKGIYPLLGPLMTRELFARAAISDRNAVAECSTEEIQRLFGSANRLWDELLTNPSPRVYSGPDHPPVFALIELRSRSGEPAEVFDSIHTAIRTFLSAHRKTQGFLREKADLETEVRHELDRAERGLAAMARESTGAERADQYELFGKLLLAHPRAAEKGMPTVEVENVFQPEHRRIAIPLDPHLTSTKNAERYFSKSKKIRRALEESAGRVVQMRDRFETLKRIVEALERVQTSTDWDEFTHQQSDKLIAAGFLTRGEKEKKEDLPPFRNFVVEGGFQVWAGKNSENNDLLTLRHARPNDLWFHARGSGGSHVVLRSGTGRGEISRRAIEQAAAIAAYYSKMKSSGIVPVAMTLRKYVRKPKGAPAGTVVIEREKVLMVQPGLPADAATK
jgi:predicted ribosome quality control (RQC) complex YloA/Tae2 family protein